MTALLAARRQHLAATLRFHAHAKSVCLGAASFPRLICTLWQSIPPLILTRSEFRIRKSSGCNAQAAFCRGFPAPAAFPLESSRVQPLHPPRGAIPNLLVYLPPAQRVKNSRGIVTGGGKVIHPVSSAWTSRMSRELAFERSPFNVNYAHGGQPSAGNAKPRKVGMFAGSSRYSCRKEYIEPAFKDAVKVCRKLNSSASSPAFRYIVCLPDTTFDTSESPRSFIWPMYLVTIRPAVTGSRPFRCTSQRKIYLFVPAESSGCWLILGTIRD